MRSNWRFSRTVIHHWTMDTEGGAKWVPYRVPPAKPFAYECRHGNCILKVWPGVLGHRFVLSEYNGAKLETFWAWRWQCTKLMRLIQDTLTPAASQNASATLDDSLHLDLP